MIRDLQTFIAIDPGFAEKNGTGWCMVIDSQIRRLALAEAIDHKASLAIRARQIAAQIPAAVQIGMVHTRLPRVIEHMRVYPGPQQKGDQNDLLDLAFLEGALSVDDTRLVAARSWKGNTPKDIMQARIEQRLRRFGVDLSGLPRAKEKRGSVLEAGGLAIWAMGLL